MNDQIFETVITTVAGDGRVHVAPMGVRYQGEFVVLMPETDIAVATLVAERLRRRIAAEPFPIEQGARRVEVTISVGIATLGRGEVAATLVKRADQALYRAKRDGRNRVVPDAA